jgi:hypothetical protein|tara:strand:- start:2173 stop:2448 length:276 start_codon:yes stop_codon:yes gene_type:complete
MSGEVISMEEFNTSAQPDIVQEDWEWAVDKSFECISEACNSRKIEMLISHLADDLVRILGETSSEKYPVSNLYDAISRGLNMGTCEHCSGE